jgi:N-acetylmuramoyl-L-alanine amidase CwlA
MAVYLTPDNILSIKVVNSTIEIKQKIIPDNTKAAKDICSYIKKGQNVKPNAKLSDGSGVPKGITIHNTENISTANATNPAEQYARATYPNGNMNGVVVHYWVYKSEIWQQLSDSEQGWHAADGSSRRQSPRCDGSLIGGNLDTIAIEIIESREDTETEDTAAKLIAYLLDKYDLSPETDIYTHQYFKPSKACPLYILPHIEKFVNMVTDYFNWIQAAKNTAVDVPDAKRLYRVQVGAFGIRANAEKLCAELRRLGYTDTYVV